MMTHRSRWSPPPFRPAATRGSSRCRTSPAGRTDLPVWLGACLLICVLSASAPAQAPTATPDPVAAYLERLGLDEFLTLRLEDQVARGAKDDVVRQLADVYASRLLVK